MPRIVLGLFVVSVIAVGSISRGLTTQSSAAQEPPTPRRYVTEEEWIAASVATAIVGMSTGFDAPAVTVTREKAVESAFLITPGTAAAIRITPSPHVWAPGAYAALATAAFAGSANTANGSDTDLSMRTALADLTVDRLLDQNARVSALLEANMRSAPAHESAALVIGAFALRESARMFSDKRPALSRMTAHLAVASALRGPAAETVDGVLARVVLTVLSGLQREALSMLDAVAARLRTREDRAWASALRLRITGDWRGLTLRPEDPLIQRLEYARAIAARRGIDEFLNYMDTLPAATEADWHRIALSSDPNVEAANVYTDVSLHRELTEAASARTRLRGDTLDHRALVAALNEPASPTPLRRIGSRTVVQVIDWGTWAGFAQRHILYQLIQHDRRLWMLGSSHDQKQAMRRSFHDAFGGLTLYPVVRRYMAQNAEEYETSLELATPLARGTPQLLSAAAWNLLREKPSFVQKAAVFPIEIPWFTPAVPTGTAYDLSNRALRAGCPRPPTKAQAAKWASDMPYDYWTVVAETFLALDNGKPTLATEKRALGPLFPYDMEATRYVLDYIDGAYVDKLDLAYTLCQVSPAQCDYVATSLLRAHHPEAAAKAFQHWVDVARDEVDLANGVTWFVRYLEDTGQSVRAEALARRAADTHAARGVEMLAELLERRRRYPEAEALYQQISDHYGSTSQIAGFKLRKALRERDSAAEMNAWEMLHPEFPEGLPKFSLAALSVEPTDGIAPRTFGSRAEAFGLKPYDVIVGVDGYRVRTFDQYNFIARLSHAPTMQLTVWRDGRFQTLTLQVPQRWFAVDWRNYTPPVRSRR